VLRAIESLGHALGMTIVAEGVETFEELVYLQTSTRIRQAQGYYFSKPFFLEEAAGAVGVNPAGRDHGGRLAAAARAPSSGRGSDPARVAMAARSRRD
jgi:cyclic di-GMP phosphodiesterase Gmr